MDLSKYDIEALRSELKRCNQWLRRSQNLVSKQGGWIMWNGDEEDRVRKIAKEISMEINKRTPLIT